MHSLAKTASFYTSLPYVLTQRAVRIKQRAMISEENRGGEEHDNGQPAFTVLLDLIA
jgi:hypothetical protein